METFINEYSWKCLLGKQSKDHKSENSIYTWKVNNKNHFCCNKVLTKEEIESLTGYSFHYLNEENIQEIKKYKKIEKQKEVSVIIDLKKFHIKGSKNSGIRHSINSAKRNNLIIKDNFDKIEDVREMLKEWSNVLGEKYFRDFSGKSEYYFSNNFHKDCINLFIYKEDKLISYASASPNKDCSYITGKALCNKIHGLSEYTDYLLYNKLINLGFEKINLGRAEKGLLFYKMKFEGANKINHYNGKIIQD